MTDLKKKRMKTVLKYTWPFYIVGALVVFVLMGFVYKAEHPIPKYKTLTIFVSGEVTDSKKLSDDIYTKFKEKQIRSFSCVSASVYDTHYRTKLTVTGYNNADVLIIPLSKLEGLENIDHVAIDLKESLVNEFYQGYTFYSKDQINYGVKVDKEKVNQYMTLPSEDCYMLLNGRSRNLGEYGIYSTIREHDMALNVVKDWGM